MSPNEELISISITQAVKNAQPAFERDLYANHAQIVITGSEMFIDFYYVTPIPGGSEPKVSYVQRLACPANLAKGIATAIANSVAMFEEKSKSKIPNNREKQPEDRITIWED